MMGENKKSDRENPYEEVVKLLFETKQGLDPILMISGARFKDS